MFNQIQPLLEKFNQLKVTNLNPMLIYHYTCPSALLNIFTKDQLWFTDRTFLNDKSEGINALDILIEVIPTTRIDEGLKSYILEKCSLSRQNILSEQMKFYVLSFSVDKDNLNLWNYYSKNNRLLGYNICFEIIELVNAYKHYYSDRKAVEPIHGKVLYVKSDKCDLVKYMVEALYDLRDNTSIDVLGDLIIKKIVFSGCLFKDEAFMNEQEYRVVLPWNPMWEIETTNMPKIEFREKDGYFIPYFPIKVDVGRCAKCVTVSPTVDYELAKASLINLLRKTPHIEIVPSSIPVRY